jgi:hypothetical protein
MPKRGSVGGSDRLPVAVEMFVYTPAEFVGMADRPFMRRVLREGIVLYES